MNMMRIIPPKKEKKKASYYCLSPSFFATFFQDEKKAKDYVDANEITNRDKIFIPACNDTATRWFLFLIDYPQNKLTFYDPTQNPENAKLGDEISKLLYFRLFKKEIQPEKKKNHFLSLKKYV